MTKLDEASSSSPEPASEGYGATTEELISLPPMKHGSTNSTIASTDSESSFLIPIGGESHSPHHASNSSSTDNQHHARNSAAADLRLSMLSNFSTAYNVLSISLALDLLSNQRPDLTVADKSLCSSALFAGMIVGQLGGGALGDILGRHLAMTVVMILQVLASFLSSLSTDVTMDWFGGARDDDDEILVSIVTMLVFWRFVLGLGCGGVYPLAATLTAESSSNANSNQDTNRNETTKRSDEHAAARRGALGFSFQGVGYLTVPIVARVVVSLLGETSDLAWRLLLGFGALPGIILTISRVRNNFRHQQKARGSPKRGWKDQGAKRAPSVLEAIRKEPQLTRKLLGTAGCWLAFDVLFYGNTLFQPIVLACAFGSEDETVHKAARDSALIASLALPGYFVSAIMVGRQSPRYIQLQGFLVMGVLYACIATYFDEMSGNRILLMGVYGSTYFFSNYGPNATTFMLPAMTYSKHCRSTLNGVCAACGKVGALIGSIVFATALQRFGQTTVFASCACLSLVGAVTTYFCVAPPDDDDGIVKPEEILTALERGNPSPGTTILHAKKRIPSVYSMPSIFDFYEGAMGHNNSGHQLHTTSA